MRNPDLRTEYVRYLARYGLRPTKQIVDPSFDADLEQAVRSAYSGMPPDEIEGLIEAVRNHRRSGAQVLVDRLADEVERGMSQLNLMIPFDFYVAAFPTGAFNAQAVPVSGGALFLLNDGLMNLLYQTLHIVARSVEPSEGQHDQAELSFRSEISPDQLDDLAEVVLAYLLLGHSGAAHRVRITASSTFLSDVVHYAELFVLAHEYAHGVAGHVASQLERSFSAGSASARIDWSHEILADMIGAEILIATLPPVMSEPHPEFGDTRHLVSCALAGPLYFFVVEDAVSRLARELPSGAEPVVSLTHPPSHLRADHLRQHIEQSGRYPPVAFVLGEYLTECLERALKSITRDLPKYYRAFRAGPAGRLFET